MKDRLRRVAKWVAYPAFYLFCLALFFYLTFPLDRLKDRVTAEIEKRARGGERVEIGKLTPYFITGVEVTNAKLYLPADESAAPRTDDGPAKDSVIAIDLAHVRVRMLPLLLGRVRVDFWASTMGGEIQGTAPVGSGQGDVELDVSHVDISKLDPLLHGAGVPPLRGLATGKLALNAPNGKFQKANGTLELRIADASVSDGKTKIGGFIELPTAKLGELTLLAEAKDGVLKVEKLAAAGTDLEVAGDGKVNLREPWNDAVADLNVRFRFTDAYRGKNATTKTLLGEPGTTGAGLIEQIPGVDMKRAKRADGFYGFRVAGPLKKLRFDPSGVDSGGAPQRRGRTPIDAPPGAPRRPAVALPPNSGDVPPPALPAPSPSPAPAPTPSPEASPSTPAPPEALPP